MTATVEGLIAYADARGTVIYNTAVTEQALTRASDYINYSYVQLFTSSFSADSPNVDPAIYEAAMLEVTTPGFFSKTYTEADRKVLVEVEGIKWEHIGSSDGVNSFEPKSSRIEAMLRPYMAAHGLGMWAV